MKLSKLESVQEALVKSKSYSYALLYYMSEVKLMEWGEAQDENSVNVEELLEARFFDDKGEIHIFEGNSGLNAIEISETDEEVDAIEETYPIRSIFDWTKTHKKPQLVIKKYIQYDSDGQAYVAACRLYQLREGV